MFDFLYSTAASLTSRLDNPSIPWKQLILTFAVGEFCLETYLQYRQYRVLQRKTIPPQLKNEIDQKTFDKSQAYGRAKAKFGLVQGIWSQIKNIAVIKYDMMPL
ncbi:hypothetical protein KC352_g14300, partial [Hortaea werneckii]